MTTIKLVKHDELSKFQILTYIKENQANINEMTVDDIHETIKEKFNMFVSIESIYRWAKIYGFTYKKKRKPRANKADIEKELQATNKRIFMLSMIMKNICIELEIKTPKTLTSLIAGLQEHYGFFITDFDYDFETKKIEENLYNEL